MKLINLTKPQHDVMEHLSGLPKSIRYLAKKIGQDRSNTAKIMNQLADMGLVEKVDIKIKHVSSQRFADLRRSPTVGWRLKKNENDNL